MPYINEFITNFGLKEIVITFAVIFVIVILREEKKIFRRKKNGQENKK